MNNISKFLFAIGSAILCLSLIPKRGNFLDVRTIILQHIKLLLNNPLQFISIFIVPSMFATAAILIKTIDANILNNLMVILSIVIAMFFAVLSILTTFEKQDKTAIYEVVLHETFNSTLFEILLCVFLLIISFITLIFKSTYSDSIELKILSGVIYYITIVIMLNILVIIKRISVLFEYRK